MRKPQEALQEILSSVRPLSTEVVDVLEARGRVLAEEVRAGRDLPPWDNSAMDGYAVRSGETLLENERTLPIAFTIAAGDLPGPLPTGKAARIMTGAPIPQGADAVIMREETDENVAGSVTLHRAVKPGENLRHKGDDVRADQVVLTPGTEVGPAEIAMLCSVGRSRVRVRRRPVVAILSTGDEIAEVGDAPHPAKIINGNAWMLAAQVAETGGIPRLLGIARDTREDLVAHLRAAEHADVLLTIGGVSVGDFDFVKDALDDVGAKMDFWKVAIRPGKPLAVGSIGNTRVFGLPGNPVSSFVTFEVFVRPALMTMLGHARVGRRTVAVKVVGKYAKKPGLTHYVRANLERTKDGVLAHLRTQQSSGAVTSISGADALVVLEHDRESVSDGDAAVAMVLKDGWER
ncbi:MAG: gephyrin-like molybdotransferase Glp [Myxococcota bacterium]